MRRVFRILIVEDNKVNQLLVCNMLKNFGFTEFDTANNGMIALEMLRQNNYDLILMDILIPGKDGCEIAAEIRNDPAFKGHYIPIIALTANASEKAKARAMHSGMNDYLVKPYTAEELHSAITAQVSKMEHAQDNQENNPDGIGKVRANIFSIHSLDKYTGGDNLLSAKLIDLLLNQIADAIEKLETLIPHGDWKQVYQIVHKLKGSIAVFEFHELKKVLMRMEEYADSHENLVEMPVLFNQFQMLSRYAMAGLA